MRILVCGVGNILRGDDGFGVWAAQALRSDPRVPPSVKVIETGIGGIHLVQELMSGYQALIVFDACDRAAEPGRLFLLEPELPATAELSDEDRRDFFADTHYATPIRALALANALSLLPPYVRVVGCQVFDSDAFKTEMHDAVSAAVPRAVDISLEMIANLLAHRDAARAQA
jgi:hydrogenase maturation protease